MAIINQSDIINEVVMSLRNNDILSTTIRNVTTTTQSGSLNNVSIITISKMNVKNVRSVKINSVVVTNYSVNLDHATGCVITLSAPVTNTYEVSYDYGTDCIFEGYPRSDFSISSFPRIAVEYIDIQSSPGGFGNVNRNKHDISILYYSTNKKDIKEVIHKIRTWCITNQNTLSQLKLIKPVMTGPILIAGEFEKFKDKVHKQNFDFAGLLQFEKN